jgi:hypothetical protein
MSEYCPSCFDIVDGFHVCNDSTQSKDGSGSQSYIANSQSLEKVVVAAPFAGLAFDFLLPLPSSILHSVFVTLLSCAAVGAIWVTLKHNGAKSPRFYARNLKNFAYTPNMIKIFGLGDSKKVAKGWLAAVVASSALQVLIFTPGNASYLGHQVTKKIDDASGANLEVKCPSTKIFLYNEKIECRVKTGLLGITVPARATLSPILGSAEIKVSLF